MGDVCVVEICVILGDLVDEFGFEELNGCFVFFVGGVGGE